MSFFSTAFKDVFGGSDSSSQQSSKSGYNALPQFAQDALKQLVTKGQSILTAPGAADMFTPLEQTADEKTAQGLSQPLGQDDIAKITGDYMNPFSKFLMDTIKNNFQGQNSLYQNQVAGSGFAPGTTNRDFLNTGYMQGQEELAAGTTMANLYDSALTKGLGQRQQTIVDLMAQGANNRQITAGIKLAPVSSLDALGQLLGYMPSTSQYQGASSVSSTPGILGVLSGFSPSK